MEISKIIKQLDLPFPLRDYQWEGVNFLLANSSALLADEMGLGKTVQVAVSLEILRNKNKSLRSLIVVPSSLKFNWEREIKLWSPSLSVRKTPGGKRNRWSVMRSPFNVIIASFSDVRTEVLEGKFNENFDIVILDEAQKIKNPRSSSSQATKMLNRQTSWALTGTPIENKKEDLVSVFNFISQGLINDNMRKSQIHRKIESFFLRRKKNEVLKEMPEIIDQVINLNMSNQQRVVYDNYYLNASSELRNEVNHNTLFSKISKLKQICNYDDESGESVKFNVLKDIVDDSFLNKRKIIIFSQYVETLKWLKQKFKTYDCDIYHGGLNESDRIKVIDSFENNKDKKNKMLLISLSAGGVGLNLQSASTVVLFDRWWNPSLENQAIARAHRFGRKEPLHVIKFLINDSIEERIDNIIKFKEELFDDFIESADSFKSESIFDELKKIF